MPRKIDAEERNGLESMSKCGLKMKIIEYRNSVDIDVEFENGIVREHCQYQAFLRGEITPNPRRKSVIAESKYAKRAIGMENMSSCGLKMKIIAYRRSTDIDVEFEDKVVREHCFLNAFLRGTISHPGIECASPNSLAKMAKRPNRKGETRVMDCCGMEATIIIYKSSHDVTVRFADGTVVEHRTYHDFQKGLIVNPTTDFERTVKNRMGQKMKTRSGDTMTVIGVPDRKYVDIRFENGYERRITWDHFKDGCVRNPSRKMLVDPIDESITHANISSMCKYHKIPYVTYKRRLGEGMTPKEALSIPYEGHGRAYKDAFGVNHRSKMDMFGYYDIDPGAYYRRIKSGISERDVLTELCSKASSATV